MLMATNLPPLQIGVIDGGVASWAELVQCLNSAAFRAFCDVHGDGIVIADADRKILLANKIAEKQLGLERKEIEGRFLDRLPARSAIDLEGFLAASENGAFLTVLKSRKGLSSYQVQGKIINSGEANRHLIVLFLREQQATEAASRPLRHGPAPDADAAFLAGPTGDAVRKSITAYNRNARILILGESGAGKTAIAQYIHKSAAPKGRPFVHVNCGSIPETLFESEVFGYERGAFTGALQNGKRGYIESAMGGTLFLDEIAEIPLTSQAKLLKFLEDGSIQPVGAAASKHVATHVIAATNRNLRDMVAAGTFRRDLYYRLSQFTIRIPGLRERGDLNELIHLLLQEVNETRHAPLRLSEDCLAALLDYHYPGNIRELRNILEHLAIVADESATAADLPEDMLYEKQNAVDPATRMHVADATALDDGLKSLVQGYEMDVISQAISKHGSKREAARHLKIDVATLIRKMRRE